MRRARVTFFSGGRLARLGPGTLAFLGFAMVLAGCGARDIEGERRTLAEQLREDSSLLYQLASYDQKERSFGVQRIRGLGREQGTLLVLYLLQEPTIDDERLEVVLARILADWKDTRAVGYLMQSINSGDAGVVRLASEGLLVFQDQPRVLAALSEKLASPVRRERLIAAELLSRMASDELAPKLRHAYRGEEDREIRALLLLGVLDGQSDVRLPTLIDALNDEDLAIRQEAWSELQRYRGLPETAYDPNAALEVRARSIAKIKVWRS